MERNPYTAPTAPVADAETAPHEQPPDVARAVWLLWTALVLGTLAIFIQPRGLMSTMGIAGVIAVALFSVAIWSWFIIKIAVGRNWARITYLVLTALGYLLIPLNWQLQVALMKANPLYAVITSVNAIINIYALFSLFTKPANAWFSPRTPSVR